MVKWSILGNKGTLLGGNHHLLAIADHFGGHSVHCGQIVQKNPCKGQTPLYGNARILGTFGPPSPPLPRLYRWGPGDPGKAKHAETVPKIILQPQVMNCIVLPTLVSVQVLQSHAQSNVHFQNQSLLVFLFSYNPYYNGYSSYQGHRKVWIKFSHHLSPFVI